MNSITYQLPMIFSSDPKDGAANISSDGSSFTVPLDRPIIVPKDVKYCWVEVQQSTVWNSVPNILTGVNDTFEFTVSATPPGLFDGTYSIVIDQGVYDVERLGNAINRGLIDAGIPATAYSFTFIGDVATQKVLIQYNNANNEPVSINFGINNSFRDLIGFDSGTYTYPGPTIDGKQLTAQNVAKFNNVEYFLIHSDLVSLGLRNNSSYSQIISQVPITEDVGHQINYSPFNPPRIPAMELIGQKRNTIKFWLTDQRNKLVNTNSEVFSVRLCINYI